MNILHDCLLFSLNRIKSMTHESPKSKFNIYFNLMSMSKSKLMVLGPEFKMHPIGRSKKQIETTQ